METLQLVAENPQALKIQLPFVASREPARYAVGDDERNRVGRGRLLCAAARTLWDELTPLPGLMHLDFSLNGFLGIQLSPACDASEIQAPLERYFGERFASFEKYFKGVFAEASPDLGKELLEECRALLGGRRRIVVERSDTTRSVLLWFRTPLLYSTIAWVNKFEAEWTSYGRPLKLELGAMYSPFKRVVRLNAVASVCLVPYCAEITFHSSYVSEKLLKVILEILTKGLYGNEKCEIGTIDPPRFTAKEIRDSKNYGGYKDHS